MYYEMNDFCSTHGQRYLRLMEHLQLRKEVYCKVIKMYIESILLQEKFLSIFRKDIWGFMSEPVSEQNERGAVTAVIDACQNALSDMLEDNPDSSDTRDNTLNEGCNLR